MKLPDGITNSTMYHVLYVLKLSYNLLSVPKATKTGKTAKFSEIGCRILDTKRKLIATGKRVGSLYYFDCLIGSQHVNVTGSVCQESKEEVWHRRFGHLGVRNLQKLELSRAHTSRAACSASEMHVFVDDLYRPHLASCAHEQKAHGQQ